MVAKQGEQARLSGIDGARGIAILAVAFFHMTRGMVQAGHLAPGVALDLADRLAYGFHVQVFFLVSGYFLADRVRTWADFAPRAVNLYWPYLLWSGISGVLLLLVPGANNTITLRQFALLPVIPLQHFWFLLYLIGCIALMVLARGRVALMTGAFLALNLAALAADLPPDTLGVTIDNATYWPAFFFAGALLARWGGFLPVRAGWFVPTVLVALGGAWLSVRSGIDIRWSLFAPVSLCACYAVLCLATWADSRLLAFLGRHSLPIYLVHVMVGSVVRALVFKLAPGAPLVPVMIAIWALSVAVPLAMEQVAARLGLGALAGFAPLMRPRQRAFIPRGVAGPAG